MSNAAPLPPPDDGRGRFPDRIAANVPRGFRRQVRLAAAAERKSAAELIREALIQRVAQVLATSAANNNAEAPARPALVQGS